MISGILHRSSGLLRMGAKFLARLRLRAGAPVLAACFTLAGSGCAPGPSDGTYLIALLGAVSANSLSATATALCDMRHDELIQPANWPALQAVLQAEAAKGVSGAPTVDTTTITGVPGTYYGGVLAPNGKIYGIPLSGGIVPILDPTTNTIDTTTITGAGTGWAGGVLAPNGKIYGIPLHATSVLIIDPATNTADTTTISGLAGTSKWAGGVLAPNGKIYGIPYNSTSVLIIDPATNTADTTTLTVAVGTAKWYAAGLAPNGNVYAPPRNNTTALKIDPAAGTVATLAGGSGGGGKFSGFTLADSGRMYTSNYFINAVYSIDPTIDAFGTADSGFASTNPSSLGIVRGVDGKLYSIPQSHTDLLIFDPATENADLATITGLAGGNKWAGGILAPNGKIYGMPFSSGNVLMIDTKANGSLCPAILQSAYFNKF